MRHPRQSLLEKELQNAQTLLSVDVVVARFKENIDWLMEVANSVPSATIYVYEKTASSSSECNALRPFVECVPLGKNVGRESFPFLYHIVRNYDKLADKTVFTQATVPGLGYVGPNLGGGHMTPDSDFLYDFVSPTTKPRIVPTFWRSAFTEEMAERMGYNDFTIRGDPERLPPICENVSWNVFNDTANPWRPKLHSQKDQFASTTDFWNAYLLAELGPSPSRWFFANGAILSAGRREIRSLSKQTYERLLDTVDHHVDPVAGYHLEHLWGYVLGHKSTLERC